MAGLFRIQFRRGTAAAWVTAAPTLSAGEPGYETDTGLTKIGDGATAWASLPYVNGGGGQSPPSGTWMMPKRLISVAAGAVTSGNACFLEVQTGPTAVSLQSLSAYVTTAQVTGSGTAVTSLGIYPDDGSGAQPLLSGGALASATIVPTSLGNRSAGITYTLAANRQYWMCLLYYASVAVTTNPVFECASSTTALWTTSGSIPSVGRYLYVPSCTALPTSGTITMNTAATGPIVFARVT